MKRLLAALVLTVLVGSPAWAVEIPGPSFRDQLSLRQLRSPRISPDGSRVVFSIRSMDWEKNRLDNELWIVRDGESPLPLTRTVDGSSSDAQWSPDSQWVAFTAKRGDRSQIHVIHAGGGEAFPITDEKEEIATYIWAPDGKSIAFVRSEPQSEAEKERERDLGRFAVEDQEYRQQHLWLVDMSRLLSPSPDQVPCFRSEAETENSVSSDPGECLGLPVPRRLTEGEFTVRNPSWSPDGSWIAFERRDSPQILSFQTADLYLLDMNSQEVRPLVTQPGFDGGPLWSPDSRWVVYSSSDGNTESDFYRNNRIFKISVEGGGPQRLGAGLDENIALQDWNPTGIYFSAWQRTQRRLFHLDPETGEHQLLSRFPDRLWSASFSQDGSRVAMAAELPGGLEELFVSEVDPWKPKQWTRMSEQINEWPLGSREVVTWPSRDEVQIEGVVYKPEGFDPTQKYPLLVVIHGGPTGIDYPSAIPGTVYPILQWLEKGAVVLRPNYRGSAGYGEAFRSLNVRNLGVGDAWDVLSGVDYLLEQGFIDPDRMGAMGWSQGGYISAFLTTNTDRFKAISVGAGISNWVTYYVNTDIHPFTRQYLQATPWEDPEIYARTSPMTNIRNASTPTLIQHGEFDRRVPIPNAYELYQGLKDMGIETQLIVYKQFGHGITRPKERLAAMQHNWDWFARFLWPDEDE